jgi:DNA-binding SARP family transcriptional activator/DNA-binding CsgD family transcriptional regulator
VPKGDTRIHLCGRLAVELDGKQIEGSLPGRQGRLLFGYLVLNRERPVRRDELTEALWSGDVVPRSGEALLAPPLSRLRKALGAGRIEGRTELSLVLPEDAWIDWEAAHAGLARSRAALGSGEERDALEAARDAAEIAGRGLLPGLEAQWIDERRRELDALRIEALEIAALAGVKVGGAELPAAEVAARAAVDAEPFRESARVALIEALWARGNLAEAMRAYEDIRVLLREELGTTPGPHLVDLHERLLAGEEAPGPATPAAEPAAARSPSVAPIAVPGRLPLPTGPAEHIIERERELAALAGLVEGAAAGEGRMALVEGPAGIGKSRLLIEARREAAERGIPTLTARGSDLEREFPFGAVRQLFEPVVAQPDAGERPFAGAAAPARALFETVDSEQDGAGADASFAVLHGLFWLTLNIAGDSPLLLAVDDLQWCDRPSQRFVAYLIRRLEGLPLLVAATLRTGEPAAETELLTEISREPLTVPVRPGPLSAPAVAELVRERLGEDADEAFCAACHDATGGNPLLLRELLTALEVDAVAPEAENTDVVRTIGPRAVSPSVLHRLARLPAEAGAAARAVAVLGEGADLTAVATLAELDESGAAEATRALTRADILRAETPLGFVHPLVRDAVYSELSPGERELQHARAARVLSGTAATPEAVATHLLQAARRGDPWVVETLEEAGRSAMRKSAPESAVTYLRRALEEPPPADRRRYVLRDLGIAETVSVDPAGADHLRPAYRELEDPEDRAIVAYTLVRALLFTGQVDEAAETARLARADLPPELAYMGLALEGVEFMSIYFGATVPDAAERLARYRTEYPGDNPGSRMVRGVAGYEWMLQGGPAEACCELALESIANPDWLAFDGGFAWIAALVPLVVADREEGLAALDTLLRYAHRSGSVFAISGVHLWRGWAMLRLGNLPEAEELLTASVDELERWGLGGVGRLYPAAFLAQTQIERDDLDGARRHLERTGVEDIDAHGVRFWRMANAELLLADDRPAEALAAADDLAARMGPITNPALMWWRSVKAEALHRLGRTREALEVAHEELELARSWGAPGTVGMALRVLGTIEGPEGIDHLKEAAELLEESTARLERAKALAALGAAYGSAGRADDARELLEGALELARICGASRLARQVRSELLASGVSPTLEPVTGVEALGDTERRVVALAAEGRTDRDIAQALFVTPKAVEDQLANAFRKLGVDSRDELAPALAGSE